MTDKFNLEEQIKKDFPTIPDFIEAGIESEVTRQVSNHNTIRFKSSHLGEIAAALILAIVIPVSVYAGVRYFGLSDFLDGSGLSTEKVSRLADTNTSSETFENQYARYRYCEGGNE